MACFDDERRCQGCQFLPENCQCQELVRKTNELEERIQKLLGVSDVWLSREGGWLTIRVKV